MVQKNLHKWVACESLQVFLISSLSFFIFGQQKCTHNIFLRPNVDRFTITFSVIWEMDKEGNIIETKFHRSIIHNKHKLILHIKVPKKELILKNLNILSLML